MPEDLLPILEYEAVLLALIVFLSFGANRVLAWYYRRQFQRGKTQSRFAYPLIQTLLGISTVVAVILALPFEDALRGQLLQFLGLAITAIVALSASTLAANAMAGMMLRAMRNFRAGDYLHVGDTFGRVTEMGLFHTEVQTEARDLTTIPNQVLVAQPTTVVHASGTLISAEVSLGYDLSHDEVSEKLVEAAGAAGLEEPFVHILALQDFTVLYRVSGFLAEVKKLLTTRSRLHQEILDRMHGAGLEIASPTLMVTRALQAEQVILPHGNRFRHKRPTAEVDAEALMFDKADQAARSEALEAEAIDLREEVALLEKRIPKLVETDRDLEERRLSRLRRRLEFVDRRLGSIKEARKKE